MAGIAGRVRLEDQRQLQALVPSSQTGLTLPEAASPASVALFLDGVWVRNQEMDGQGSLLLPAPPSASPRTVTVFWAQRRSTRCS